MTRMTQTLAAEYPINSRSTGLKIVDTLSVDSFSNSRRVQSERMKSNETSHPSSEEGGAAISSRSRKLVRKSPLPIIKSSALSHSLRGKPSAARVEPELEVP